MGKEKPQQSNISYMGVSEGMFIETYNVSETTAGAEKIIVTNPQTKESYEKWVIKYRSLTGFIKNISWAHEDRIKSDQLKIELYDPEDNETIVIQTGFNTGYARDFIKRLPNVKNFEGEVKLTCYQSQREDDPSKYNTGISIREKEGLEFSKNPIPYYWTKDTPHNAPQITDEGVNGDFDIWKIKFSKYLKSYLDNEIPKKIVPDVGKNVSSMPTVKNEITTQEINDISNPEEDDLPF